MIKSRMLGFKWYQSMFRRHQLASGDILNVQESCAEAHIK